MVQLTLEHEKTTFSVFFPIFFPLSSIFFMLFKRENAVKLDPPPPHTHTVWPGMSHPSLFPLKKTSETALTLIKEILTTWLLYSAFVLKCIKVDPFLLFLSQGQVESCVKIQERAPQNAQFYIVAQGSKLKHVTEAKRGNDEQTLYFTVPGKFILEDKHSLFACLFLTNFQSFYWFVLCLPQATTA